MKAFILKIYYSILAMLARRYLKKTKPYIIGITWSIGKTSSRMIIYQIIQRFSKKHTVYTSNRNFNGEFGMSLSIFCIEDYEVTVLGLLKLLMTAINKAFSPKKKYDIIILEYGIDHPWEMEFLLNIAKPHIAIVTKIDKVHSMQFTSPDIIAQEKYKLAFGAQNAVFLNIDDEYSVSGKGKCKVTTFLYSTSGEMEWSDLQFSNVNFQKDEENIKINFDALYPWDKKINITSNLFGQENYGYVTLWLNVASQCLKDLDKKSLLRRYDGNDITLDLELQSGRFSVLKWVGDSILIDSTYNASPLSIKKLIENIFSLRNNIYPDYKIILALGDMRELGDYTEQEHRQIAWIISQVGDFAILVWESMELYAYDELGKIGFSEEKMASFRSSTEAGKRIKEIIEKNGADKFIVLFKWSQNTIFMEEALKQVLADKSEKDKLVRQSEFWMSKKWVE